MTMRGPALAPVRAYSLIELAMAMALAGVIAAGAIGTFSLVNRSVLQLRQLAAVDTKVTRVLGRLIADVQEVGGGAVRPWHAIFVQPGDAASDFNDGALMFTADPSVASCPIVAWDVSDSDMTIGPRPDGACCLRVGAGDINVAEAEPLYLGRFAIASLDDDAAVVALRSADAVACTAEIQKFMDIEMSAGRASLANGTLTIVDAKWLFVDIDEHALKAWLLALYEHVPDAQEVPPGQSPESVLIPMPSLESEPRVLARDIYDFQISNGYDANSDGVVTSTPDGSGDEWLGNRAGEVRGPWIGDELADFGVSRSTFRMLEIAITIGLPSKLATERPPVQILDGPERDSTGLIMRSAKGRAHFRNAGVFQ